MTRFFINLCHLRINSLWLWHVYVKNQAVFLSIGLGFLVVLNIDIRLGGFENGVVCQIARYAGWHAMCGGHHLAKNGRCRSGILFGCV